MKVIPEARHVH